MKHLVAEARKLQEPQLLPDCDGEWKILGVRFAGGKFGLGTQVEQVKEWRGKKADPATTLGALMLSSVGLASADIGSKLGCISRHTVEGTLRDVQAGLNVSQRQMLFPAALRDKVLRLTTYGSSEVNFRATPYELTQLGFLARGIARPVLAAACEETESGLNGTLSKMNTREGVGKAAGCIAGAILTRQLGATTCVPLLATDHTPGRVDPIMPVTEWEELIAEQDVDTMRGLFRKLAVLE